MTRRGSVASFWVVLFVVAMMWGCGESGTAEDNPNLDGDMDDDSDEDATALPDGDDQDSITEEPDEEGTDDDSESPEGEIVDPEEVVANTPAGTTEDSIAPEDSSDALTFEGSSPSVAPVPPAAVAITSARIGSGGGSMELEGMSISIPAGALGSDTTIAISETDLESPEGIVGVTPIYRCEPTGMTFEEPISVTLTFEGDHADDVKVIWSGHDGAPAEVLDGTVEENTITVTNTHCSILEAIVAGYELYEYYSDDSPDGWVCPDGNYQCEGQDSCCPNGYSCVDDDKCLMCPANSYLCEGTELCCPNGSACHNNQCLSCPAGNAICEADKCCPVGSSCLGINKCVTCSPGSHQCSGMEACCKDGTECWEGYCIKCPAGSRLNKADGNCYAIQCPGGASPCGSAQTCCTQGQTCSNGACVTADVNECLTNNGGCDLLTTCTNTYGSRVCGRCPNGYTGTGETGCSDINECQTNNGGCDPLTTCTNTTGSRTCSACPNGYTGTGQTGCADINECLSNNGGCDLLTTCTNTTGSRSCGVCPNGYTGTGETGCLDISDCETNNGGCDPLTTCTNTAGSRICGPCPNGYTGTGETSCVDVNECQTNNGGCDPLTTCTNTAGSRTCGSCPNGYTGTGETSCVDVNECQTNNGGCDPLTTCTNTAGSRTCGSCPNGYTGTGETSCVDVNECQTNNGGCDPLTTCTNTAGSRTCGSCPNGYTGTGETSCVDVNECQTNNGGCDPLTTCTNTAGSRTCGSCPNGYTGTGETSCVDVNECQTNNGGCDPLTTCTNTAGSRTCGSCPNGYTGTGETGCTILSYSLGGTVDNLNGTVVLQNGAEQLSISQNGSFTFQQLVMYNASYNVTVAAQPTGQSCAVSAGAGTMGAGNVTSVHVNCSNNTYSISGVVYGLYGSFQIQLNGGSTLSQYSQSGDPISFSFSTKVAYMAPYVVTVSQQPPTRLCSVSNGSGTMGVQDITNVVIDCVDPTTAKRVFTTAATYHGALGNLSGADAKCQVAADAAGLSGTYRAYISGNDVGGSVSSPTRLSHSSGVYYKMDGTNVVTVANNWDDFFTLEGSDYLRSSIDRDEYGNAVSGGVFTGTQIDGSFSSTSHHCNLWSVAVSNYYGLGGSCTATNAGWTHAGSAPCSTLLHLYCFEQ